MCKVIRIHVEIEIGVAYRRSSLILPPSGPSPLTPPAIGLSASATINVSKSGADSAFLTTKTATTTTMELIRRQSAPKTRNLGNAFAPFLAPTTALFTACRGVIKRDSSSPPPVTTPYACFAKTKRRRIQKTRLRLSWWRRGVGPTTKTSTLSRGIRGRKAYWRLSATTAS